MFKNFLIIKRKRESDGQKGFAQKGNSQLGHFAGGLVEALVMPPDDHGHDTAHSKGHGDGSLVRIQVQKTLGHHPFSQSQSGGPLHKNAAESAALQHIQ